MAEDNLLTACRRSRLTPPLLRLLSQPLAAGPPVQLKLTVPQRKYWAGQSQKQERVAQNGLALQLQAT